MRNEYNDIEEITYEYFEEKIFYLIDQLKKTFDSASLDERGTLDVTTWHDAWVLNEMIDDMIWICESKIRNHLIEKNKNGKITKIE